METTEDKKIVAVATIQKPKSPQKIVIQFPVEMKLPSTIESGKKSPAKKNPEQPEKTSETPKKIVAEPTPGPLF